MRAALAGVPEYHAARFELAMLLLQQQNHAAARAEAETLLAHQPDDRDTLKLFGVACIGMGDYEPVIDLYERLARQPQSPAELADLRLWRANALKITGRTDEAIADYRAALAARPDQAVAWFSLANLKTYRFTDAEIAAMRAAEARPGIHPMDRTYLCFALGKAFEDRATFAESWAFYARGNALRRASATYRPDVAEACAMRIAETCTADFFAERTGWGVADAAPLFVLGLPRSGSTLIEQILASHPQVEGTQELTEISRYAREICGADPDCGLPLHPQALARLTAADARALGERFLAETRTYRRLGRPFFIDKMPNNFWHIGLIQLILPRATIIDIRRDPMACGFSNLKQLFGTNHQEFSYSIDDVARHTRVYLGLMRHWDAVLPGRVLQVSYENLVAELEGGVRQMLAHAGLPFDPACLAFHETRRSVRTPSSEQVRRPIDRAGLDQWRNYAPWLAPLRAALSED
ncbi:tetratricopeptide (TPR) repeat protein [Sphingomonas sp. PvP055]|uniref:sulfotransferase n=1 Tax=Sphingomonas sp. PvP055 TaxID=3156391 RepID=UPI003398C5DD